MRQGVIAAAARMPPSEKLSGVRLTIPITLGIGSPAGHDLSPTCFPPRCQRSLAHDVIPAAARSH